MTEPQTAAIKRQAWNAGRTVGAKRALEPKQIWQIRFDLNQNRRLRDRALFDLAIDNKLCGCDLVRMKIGDILSGGQIRTRAIVMQQKTSRPVQFELLADARASLLAWLERWGGTVDDYVFPSRDDHDRHLTTRQYARLADDGVTAVGLKRSSTASSSRCGKLNRVRLVPEYDASLSASWRPWKGLLLRGEVAASGSTPLNPENSAFQDAVVLIGGQIGWEAEHWTARLYVENLTDQRVFNTNAFASFAFGNDGTLHAGVASPRVVGLQISYRW